MSFLGAKKVKDVEQELEYVKKITDKRLTQLERDLRTLCDDQNNMRRNLDMTIEDCRTQIGNLVGAAEARIGNRLKSDLPPALLSPLKAEWTKWEEEQNERVRLQKESLDQIRQYNEIEMGKFKEEIRLHLLRVTEEQQKRSGEVLQQAREEYLELGKSLIALPEVNSSEQQFAAKNEAEACFSGTADDDVCKDDNDIIWLNVGGKIFCSSSETLKKSNFFNALLSGRNKKVKKDGESRFFIDRSPETFQILLEFLRTGELPKVMSRDEREALRRDATFFVVPDLQEHIDNTAQNHSAFAHLWRSNVKEDLRVIHARESPLMESASETLFSALEDNKFWIFGGRIEGSLGGKEMLLVYLAPSFDANQAYEGDELGIGRRSDATIWHPNNENIRHLVMSDKRTRKMFRAYLTQNYGVSFDVFFPMETIGADNAICVLGIFLIGAKIHNLQKVVRMIFNTWSSSFSFDCVPEDEDSIGDMCTIS